MLRLSAPGVVSSAYALRDSNGKGLLPVQVDVPPTATVTYRINGRVRPDMQWVELKSSASGFLETLTFVPYIQLQVLTYSGTGEVRLCVYDA